MNPFGRRLFGCWHVQPKFHPVIYLTFGLSLEKISAVVTRESTKVQRNKRKRGDALDCVATKQKVLCLLEQTSYNPVKNWPEWFCTTYGTYYFCMHFVTYNACSCIIMLYLCNLIERIAFWIDRYRKIPTYSFEGITAMNWSDSFQQFKIEYSLIFWVG